MEIIYVINFYYLTTRQKTKLRNAFENHKSTDIKCLKLKYLK